MALKSSAHFNKKRLKQEVASHIPSLTQDMAGQILDEVFLCIERHLAAGEKVLISDFGCFEPVRRPGRSGTHPRSLEVMYIPSHMTVIFRPGKALRSSMQSACIELSTEKDPHPVIE